MPDPKESSSLSAKKPKAKAAKAITATKPSLSSEFVLDSDDSGHVRTERVKKPVLKTINSKPSLAKSTELKPSTSQAKPSKKRKSSSPISETDDSSGSGSDNDSSSEDDQVSSKRRKLTLQDGSPKSKSNPVTARPIPARPSMKPSTHVKPLHQKKGPGPSAAREEPKSDAEESSEASSSGSESEGGSGGESTSASSAKTSLQSPRKRSPARKSVPPQSTRIYEPPAGFKSASISSHPASKLSEILAQSSLQGKQIWHITAPDSVPISLVKEVWTQNIGNGASILEYHGAKYGLVPESENEQFNLLLPSIQTSDYRPSKSAIIKTLHLQQIVRLPIHISEPAVQPDRAGPDTEAYRKPPRQQPEGLRMRYRPFGVSDGSDSDSDSEHMPKAPREFRIPAPVKESSPGKKRKRLETNKDSDDTHSAVKSKKRKHSPHVTAEAIEEDPMDVDAVVDLNLDSAKSPTNTPHRSESNGVKFKSNLPNGNEIGEQHRRKRREKKNPENEQASPSKLAPALPLDLKQDAETIQPGEVIEGASSAVAANAVEGSKSINTMPPPRKEPKDEKAKRKEERRRRKEIERANRGASSFSVAEDVSSPPRCESRDQVTMMREIEDAQRDAEVLVGTPSPRKEARSAPVSEDLHLDSTQDSQLRELKAEKAKRREERRKRRRERENA